MAFREYLIQSGKAQNKNVNNESNDLFKMVRMKRIIMTNLKANTIIVMIMDDLVTEIKPEEGKDFYQSSSIFKTSKNG